MRAVRGNLVDLAGEAGYTTSWLMNQDPHISLLTGVHADRMVYPPSLRTLAASRLPLDEILLPEFRRQITQTGHARFIGLHVIGSHWAYDSRYPPGFEPFGSGVPLTYQDAISDKSDQRVVDAYDNSVAYSDWFLSQLIDEARKLAVPVTVTYFSDHGEDIYALDGRSGHGAPVYSQHQFDIPAFVWVNAAYPAGSSGQSGGHEPERDEGNSQPQYLLFACRSHGYPLAGSEARGILRLVDVPAGYRDAADCGDRRRLGQSHRIGSVYPAKAAPPQLSTPRRPALPPPSGSR